MSTLSQPTQSVQLDREAREKRVGDLYVQLTNLRGALEQRGCNVEYIDQLQYNGNPFFTPKTSQRY
jgi:DNA-dependent RNA polymerase auxiliary subunit epsilon